MGWAGGYTFAARLSKGGMRFAFLPVLSGKVFYVGGGQGLVDPCPLPPERILMLCGWAANLGAIIRAHFRKRRER
jgi:hypothetical protein